MKRNLISLAVASAIVGSALFAPQAAFAQSAEIEALKAQLAALSAKIDQLEKSQTQTKKTVDETQATADKTADVVAQEKSRLSFAGDVRYRNALRGNFGQLRGRLFPPFAQKTSLRSALHCRSQKM